MVADHRAQVEDLLAGYRRSREQLGAVQQRLASVRESVTSDDGLVTATVGPTGALIQLHIADQAYRALTPAALAELVVRTTAAATAKGNRVAGEALAPVLPAGADPEALLHGSMALTPTEVTPQRPAAPMEESYEDKSWMQPGGTSDARR